MGTLIFGILALAVVLVVLHGFSRAKPQNVINLAAVLKLGGGIAALAIAAVLGLRGRVELAATFGIIGLSLLGWLPWSVPGLGKRTQKSAGQVSRVRSAFIEMELDHDTGAMRGTIIAGSQAGQSLDALDVATLLSLLPTIDEESRALLMAYLDRRAPGWRDHAQAGATAGPGSWDTGKMTEEEAYQILGLAPGASINDISRAHRTLMKKLHPDQGGSTYLAARVNEAKDVLTRRHR